MTELVEIPQYLYHYTSIETLSLILKYGKIRFNSIGKLDDLTECLTSDVGNISALALVSCWTDVDAENISLWNMYCKNGNGVRIKMRPTIFHNGIRDKSTNFHVINDDMELFYPVNFLFKIHYKENIIRTIRGKEQGSIDITRLGKEKDICWEFQNEWRFIMYQFPSEKELFNRLLRDEPTLVKDILINYNFKYSYFDLSIQSNEWNYMEIVLGPSTTQAEEIIVGALIEKYNPKAVIRRSSLTDKVKLK